jgi:hypothetical protein
VTTLDGDDVSSAPPNLPNWATLSKSIRDSGLQVGVKICAICGIQEVITASNQLTIIYLPTKSILQPANEIRENPPHNQPSSRSAKAQEK